MFPHIGSIAQYSETPRVNRFRFIFIPRFTNLPQTSFLNNRENPFFLKENILFFKKKRCLVAEIFWGKGKL
ncbi:MAG: hypothetical protein EAY81_05085 [Bacteroidetes bacterium]|nr:MAG: hypothetical protein EAY81_05085 [Bacteroidota bacterium]